MEAAYEDQIKALTEVHLVRRRKLQALAWRTLAIRGVRPSATDVEDALGEAYLRAATRFRKEPDLRIENLEAWYRTLLYIVCLKQADERHKLRLSETIEEIETELAVLESSTFSKILAGQVLAKIEPLESKILQMSAEGFTSDEIAAELNSSSDQVRQIKSRAIQKLKRALLVERVDSNEQRGTI
jgi:RNA polymerase sigma factor (sigma-70 family)